MRAGSSGHCLPLARGATGGNLQHPLTVINAINRVSLSASASDTVPGPQPISNKSARLADQF